MATYHVKTGGNDASAGTTDGTAWAHHPWMSTWTGSVTLVAGDTVCMNRGDTWTIASPVAAYMTIGQSGSAGLPITTTWYGAGAKPIINISTNSNYPVIRGYGKSYIVFDNLEISHYASTRALTGQHGIVFGKDVSLNVPHDIIVTNCTIHNCPQSGIWCYDDCYNIIVGDINAVSCATDLVYSNNIYDCGYGGIILLGCNPTTDRSDWYIYYNYVHDIDYSAVAVEDAYGITVSAETFGAGQDNSHGYPSYCYIRYNRVEDVPAHEGLDTHGGTYQYFQDNYIYNCRVGIATASADRVGLQTPVLQYCYIERNIVENPSAGNTLDDCQFIYLVGENSSYRPTNCYIRNNILFYTSIPSSGETNARGIYVYNVDGITISGNHIYNGPSSAPGTGGGIVLSSYSSGYYIKNVNVFNNYINSWGSAIHTRTSNIDGLIQIYYNIILSNRRVLVFEDGATAGSIYIYNNTFLTSDITTLPWVIDFSGAVTLSGGNTIYVKNNILGFTSSTSDSDCRYILAPGTITGTFESDYNLFWNSTYASPFYYAGSTHTLTEWQGHGFDVNSPNVTGSLDPLFENRQGDYSTNWDFIITTNSPAKNAGVDVSLTTDYFGNAISGNPDIGANEFSYVYGFSAKHIKVSVI